MKIPFELLLSNTIRYYRNNGYRFNPIKKSFKGGWIVGCLFSKGKIKKITPSWTRDEKYADELFNIAREVCLKAEQAV